MAPLDNVVVLLASLLVGGVGIHLGARLLVSAHDYLDEVLRPLSQRATDGSE